MSSHSHLGDLHSRTPVAPTALTNEYAMHALLLHTNLRSFQNATCIALVFQIVRVVLGSSSACTQRCRNARRIAPSPHPVLARSDLWHVVVLAEPTEIFVQFLNLLFVRLDALSL
jgi:hypothetical protein